MQKERITKQERNSSSLAVVTRVVVNSLPSPLSKRVYGMAIHDFLNYLETQENPVLDKLFLQSYIAFLQYKGTGEGSINLRLAAIRRFCREAIDLKIWSEEIAVAFNSVKNIPQRGHRTGNWLSLEQVQQLINTPDASTPLGLRNRAILATLVGCGLRRHELVKITLAHLQLREGRWVIAELVGKRNKTRTVTMPTWVKQAIDVYLAETKITSGPLFQTMIKGGHLSGRRISSEVVRNIVQKYSKKCNFRVTPHDLRRTYAKLSFRNGARIDQIQLNLGHKSLTTTQVYLGNELDYQHGPGDFLPIQIS